MSGGKTGISVTDSMALAEDGVNGREMATGALRIAEFEQYRQVEGGQLWQQVLIGRRQA